MRSTNPSSLFHRQSGLTLIEVMVALLIFSLTATAIVKAAGDNINGVGQIESITFATWVANNRLTRLHVEPTWPVKNNQTGSEEMSGKTWFWRQEVEKTNDENMVQVTVLVGENEKVESSVTSVTAFVTRK
jgi:general secretion pathway protein I